MTTTETLNPKEGDGFAALDDCVSHNFDGLAASDPGFDHQDWSGRTIAGDALARKIRAAPSTKQRVDIVGARIVGDVPLAGADVPGGIRLTRCLVYGTIDLEVASPAVLDLSDSKLQPPQRDRRTVAINASGSHFSNDVRLEGTIAFGELRFPATQVDGCFEASWLSCEVTDAPSEAQPATPGDGQRPARGSDEIWSLDLTNGAVKHDLSLEQANLLGGLAVAGCAVGGQLNCINMSVAAVNPAATTVKRFAVRAQRATIGESVLLLHDQVPATPAHTGVVSFHGAHITGGLDLSRAVFDLGRDPAATTNAVPPIALDLELLEVERLIFRHAKIARGEFDLTSATVKRLSDDPTSWATAKGRYCLNGFAYDALDVDYPDASGSNHTWTSAERRTWLAESADHDAPGPYLALADAHAKQGDPSGQRKALIEASDKAATRIEKIGLGWVRYGYRPWTVLFPLLILIGITGGLFSWALSKDNGIVETKPSDPPVLTTKCDPAKVSCPNTVVYAIDAVIPVDLGQTATWRPNEANNVGLALAWTIRIDLIVSWALTGVLLAAVAGLLKRT